MLTLNQRVEVLTELNKFTTLQTSSMGVYQYGINGIVYTYMAYIVPHTNNLRSEELAHAMLKLIQEPERATYLEDYLGGLKVIITSTTVLPADIRAKILNGLEDALDSEEDFFKPSEVSTTTYKEPKNA